MLVRTIGCEMQSEKQIELSLRHLDETIAWCEPRFSLDDVVNCLRTPALKPANLFWGGDHSEFAVDSVRHVVERRSQLLDPSRLPSSTSTPQGRLLVLNLNINLSHGFAEDDTDGYFDVDMPPWDSWVWYAEGFLVCWIPKELLEKTGFGAIECCPTGSFGWFDCYPNDDWRDVLTRVRFVK